MENCNIYEFCSLELGFLIGFEFLFAGSGDGGENRDVYLQLSVIVLAAFCRVPEIASSVEMVSRIPLILEIMSKGYVRSSDSLICDFSIKFS